IVLICTTTGDNRCALADRRDGHGVRRCHDETTPARGAPGSSHGWARQLLRSLGSQSSAAPMPHWVAGRSFHAQHMPVAHFACLPKMATSKQCSSSSLFHVSEDGSSTPFSCDNHVAKRAMTTFLASV